MLVTKERDNFSKILSILLIMNCQSSSFGDEDSGNENLWNGQKVEILMIFLSFVDLRVDQRSEQVTLCLKVK